MNIIDKIKENETLNNINEYLTDGYENESIETFGQIDSWEQKQENAEQLGKTMWAKVTPWIIGTIIVGTIMFRSRTKKIKEQQKKELEKQKKEMLQKQELMKKQQKQIEKQVIVRVRDKERK